MYCSVHRWLPHSSGSDGTVMVSTTMRAAGSMTSMYNGCMRPLLGGKEALPPRSTSRCDVRNRCVRALQGAAVDEAVGKGVTDDDAVPEGVMLSELVGVPVMPWLLLGLGVLLPLMVSDADAVSDGVPVMVGVLVGVAATLDDTLREGGSEGVPEGVVLGKAAFMGGSITARSMVLVGAVASRVTALEGTCTRHRLLPMAGWRVDRIQHRVAALHAPYQ